MTTHRELMAQAADTLEDWLTTHVYDESNGDDPSGDPACELIRQLRLASLQNYCVAVNYRTNTGCNTRNVFVDAVTPHEALQLASDKVRKRKGVIRIDGGTLIGCPLPVDGA